MKAQNVENIKRKLSGSLNPYCIGTVIERLALKRRQKNLLSLNPYCIGTVIERQMLSTIEYFNLRLNPYCIGTVIERGKFLHLSIK